MSHASTLLRVAAALAAVAPLIAGCASPRPASPAQAPAPGPALAGEQCLSDLGARGVNYRLAAIPVTTGPCSVENPVQVTSAAVPWNQPAVMTCGLADRVDRFLVEAAEPLARRYLATDIVRLDHFGAYSCRPVMGQAGRWSEHAAGRAIDVSGFLMKDGERVSVEHDWRTGGPKSEFLHALAKRACDYFNLVLTPDSDKGHYNHLHLDIGHWRLCQA
ncbi:MAG TPA: extensin family protein [Stellaceae bacterium]|nr:extensin family protein [Stellaceae bacterium]